ncbi:hypothetical protein ACHAWX_000239 [Stephanocyclus meneghinianus]
MYPRITKALHQQRQHIHRAPLLAAAVASASAALRTNDDDRHDSPSISIPSSFLLATPTDRRRALCDPLPTTTSSSSSLEESEPERFRRTLALHRARIADYRSRWEYKMPSSSSSSSLSASAATPARSWPEDIPEDNDLSMLLRDVRYCDRSPNFRSDKDYCALLRFRAACALLAREDEPRRRRGLDMLRTLAEKGYRDAMTYYGMCLNEGRGGVEPNPVAAVSWFRRCSDMYDHAQSQYELGVAYYMGEGVVENGEEAVRWFLRAAEKDHAAACYMLGDCLLDGEGVEMDRALALEWLVKSAELGHR